MKTATQVAGLVLFMSVFTNTSALAATAFDFEGTPLGATQGALVVTDGGVSLTVTTEGNPLGWLHVDNSDVALVGIGVIGANNSILDVDDFQPMRFTFSQPISDITFSFGDTGGDDDSPWFINAFDAANNLLSAHTGNYAADFDAGMTDTFNNIGGGGASYFIVSSTPTFNPYSMYWDVKDYSVAAIPEPEAYAMLLAGLGLIGFMAHRGKQNG